MPNAAQKHCGCGVLYSSGIFIEFCTKRNEMKYNLWLSDEIIALLDLELDSVYMLFSFALEFYRQL